MVISIDAERAPDKIEHPFLFVQLNQVQGHILQHSRGNMTNP